jgi:hypothetical protein
LLFISHVLHLFQNLLFARILKKFLGPLQVLDIVGLPKITLELLRVPNQFNTFFGIRSVGAEMFVKRF